MNIIYILRYAPGIIYPFRNYSRPPPQGRTFFERFFRPYRPSLTTKIFPLWFPYKNTCWFFLQRGYRPRTNGGLCCSLSKVFITILLWVRRLLRNYLSMVQIFIVFFYLKRFCTSNIILVRCSKTNSCNHLDLSLAKVAKRCNHLDLLLAKVAKL